MQRLRLVISGLFAVAAATPLVAGDRVAQENAAKATHVRAVVHPEGANIRRAVTRGMRPQAAPAGQAQDQQLALVAQKRPGATKSTKDEPASKPNDIIIDVIVAYTKKAASNYADIEHELVDLAIGETNKSFRLSNLGHIKLRLVHAYQTDYVEEGAHFDHVWRFADKGDGYMEEIHRPARQVSRRCRDPRCG